MCGFLLLTQMYMKTEYVPYFRTQDFEEAIILASAGAILSHLEWDHGGEIATFVFEDEMMVKILLDKHKRKELRLTSHDVLFAYREVKNQLYRRK